MLYLDYGSLGESGSIHTQKRRIEKYCCDNDLTIKKVYVDNYYSGLNFEIPVFNRLIADIK